MEKFMLGVYFRDIKIGTLTFENGTYVYKAIPNNVKRAHQKGYVTAVYGCDEDFVSKELPMAIEEFIPPEEIVDLNVMANINSTDTPFQKLCKMGMLDLTYENFYLKTENY